MVQFFGCLGVLFLGIVLIVLAFFGSIIDSILVLLGLKKRRPRSSGFGTGFGFGSTGQQQSSNDQYRSSEDSSTRQTEQPTRGQQTHKIFEKDDSEYVEFEEV